MMAPSTGLSGRTRAALADVVGGAHLLTDPELRASYEVDWTGRFRGVSAGVVRPGTAAEVAEVLRLCSSEGIALVVQGGNTGLVGGGVPGLPGAGGMPGAGGSGGSRGGMTAPSLVLSTRRLSWVGEPDMAARQLSVGAGTTLAALQAELRGAGMELGVDLASRESATLGGMAATNAGGLHVLRHGTMRAQVTGVEVALPGGQVVAQMRGLAKDTSGYELAGLLVGSEGTLGVLTALRLRIVRTEANRAVALLGLRSIDDALAVGTAIRELTGQLSAAELIAGSTLEVTAQARACPLPLTGNHAWYLLVECASDEEVLAPLVRVLDHESRRLTGSAVASEPAGTSRLWRYREQITEALAALGSPHKLDVSLPLPALGEFVARAPVLLRQAGRERDASVHASLLASVHASVHVSVHVFGHLLDGNLHLNFLGIPEETEEDLDTSILELAVSLGGSIGAEHGIGRAKTRWMHLVRPEGELALFRALKGAFDPLGIMNPGVLLPGRE